MPDTFRLVTIGPDGRARLELELNDSVAGIYRERDSFSFTPAARRERAVTGDGRYQGGRVIDTAHDTSTASVVLNVTGAGTELVAAARAEALLMHADRIVGDGDLYLEWRPAGLPRSVYLPLRGPATVKPTYKVQAFDQSAFLPVEVSWPGAPLWEGLPMDIDERWAPPPDKRAGIVNEVLNPNMEAGVAGYWTAYQNTVTATIVDDATVARSGSNSAKLTATVSPGGGAMGTLTDQTKRSVCKPGDTVVAAGYTRPAATVRATFAIIGWHKADGSFISSVSGASTNNVVGAWTRTPTVTGVAPVGATRYAVYTAITAPALNEVHNVDDVMSVVNPVGGVLPAYADGDDPAFRWEGIRHQSRSIELVESKAADYVAIDGGAADPVTITPDGLTQIGHAGSGNTRNALYHVGRGYMVADAESVATGYYLGASSDQVLNPGLAYDPADGRYFACMYTGGLLRLYYYDGSAFTILVGPAAAALTVGKLYSVVIRKTGNRLEGELWAGEPVRGGAPLTAASFDLTESTAPRASDMGETRRGYGMPRAYYAGAGSSSVVKRWRFLPYSITPRTGSPHPFLLLGIPGNAPAKAEIELSTGAAVQVPYALLGWRKRLRHDLVWNGDFAQDLDGWSSAVGFLIGAGATLARVASGGPNDSAYLQVTSAAVANSGAAFIGWGRMRAGRTYTLEFFANQVSGTWETGVVGDNVATISQGATALAGAAGVWTRQQVTFRNAIDRDRFDVAFRQVAATAGNVLRLAGVRLWEGLPVDAPPPESYAQRDGRGAYAPFGILHAMGDDVSARVGFTQQAVAGSIAGQRMRLTAPTLTGTLEFGVDATLLALEDDADRGEVDVEVYAMGAIGSGVKTPRIALSTRSADVNVTPAYTREDGSVGKAIVLPATGTRDRAFRLGTITLPRDPELNGATRLRVDVTLGVASSGYLELEYLVLVIRGQRAGSPTGLVFDAAYPTFLPAQASPASKTIRHDLSGLIGRGQTAARSTGLAGAPLELPAGDVELVAWMQEAAVPDDPSSNDNVANDANVNVHVAITPRYRLMRDS